MATAVHAAPSPLSSTPPTSPSSTISMSPRKFALAQVHSDVCLVQGKVLSPLSAAHFPNAFFFVLLPPPARPVPLPCVSVTQCAPRSHTKAATRRSARSKRKSMLTSSSPSSGTPTPPCFTRRTSGFSSGSTSRACWTRRTRGLFSSLETLWNVSDDSRIAGCL